MYGDNSRTGGAVREAKEAGRQAGMGEHGVRMGGRVERGNAGES